MAGNQITFGVGFNVNESNLNKLKQSLVEIQKMSAQDLLGKGSATSLHDANEQLKQIKTSATEVQNALNRAFNADLGTTNIVKFNQELQKLNLGQIAQQFNNVGATGQSAFLAIAGQALSTNTQLRQSYTWLTQIGTTLANTIKWNIASSAVNAFTGSIQSAFNYVKVLDASLTDIRIVTGQSREEMSQFAVEANRAAQALGRQTKEYTNAALAFYQQGLSDREVRTRTEASLKAQNITGAGTEIVDQLTAVWNGFQVTTENTEKYVDKLAAVADSSASNLSELATGMSKVASTANSMGVDIDQLTAQLATIIATTRQAPETVGNALKTIYARINDIKAGTDEAEISLGNYTSKMASLGVSVLDASGHLRDTGDVMTEIGERWNTMTREQQIYLAQTMAGQRQMNNLIALFDNWEKYSEMLNVSLNAQGTLNEKNARYMDSLAAHINQFKAAVEGMQDSLIDEDAIMGVYDAGTKLVNVFKTFIDSIGGMQGVLVGLGAIGTRVFSEQISNSIVTAINNIRVYKQNLEEIQARQEVLKAFNMNEAQYNQLANTSPMKQGTQAVFEMVSALEQYRSVMSASEKTAQESLISQRVEIGQSINEMQQLVDKVVAYDSALQDLEASQGIRALQDVNKLISGNIFQANADTGMPVFNLKAEQIQEVINNLELLNAEYQDWQKALGNISDIERQEKLVQRLTEEYNNLAAAGENTREIGNALATAINKLEAMKSAAAAAGHDIQSFKTYMQDAAQSGELFGNQTEHVIELINELNDSENLSSQELANNQRIINELVSILKSCGVEVEKLSADFKNLGQATQDVQQKAQNVKQAFEQLKSVLSDKTFAQNVTDIFRGISSVAMGIQSLSRVSQTYQKIQDGTVSAMEGWLSIIMSISMGLPMLVSGIQKLATSLGGVINYIVGHGAAIIGILGSIAPYALAIAGVAAALYGVYSIATKGERELANLEKAADKAATAYSEAKDKYEDLKASITDYQDARAAIEELTAGTAEWRDAISEANDKVLELLKNYPELVEYLREGPNGLYFDEEGLAKQQQSAQQATTDAYVKSLFAQAQVINKRASNAKNIVNPLAQQNLMEPLQGVTEEFAQSMVWLADYLKDNYADVYDKLQAANGDTESITQIFTEFADDIEAVSDIYNVIGLNIRNQSNREDIIAAFARNTEGIINYFDDASKLLREKQDSIRNGNRALAGEIARVYIESLSDATQEELTNATPEFQDSFKTALKNKILPTLMEEDWDALVVINEDLENFFNTFSSFAQRFDSKTLQGIANLFGGDSNLDDFLSFSTAELGELFIAIRQAGDEFAQELGWTGVDAINDAISILYQNIGENQQKIIGSLSPIIQDWFNQLFDTRNLNLVDTQNISNLLEYIWKNIGLSGKEFLENQDIDFLTGLGEFFKNGEVTDINQLTEYLKNSTENVVETLDALRLGSDDLVPSLDQLAGSFTEAKKVADKLNFADVLDDEDDISALIGVLGDQFDDFFAKTAGGAMQLVTSGEELRQTLDNIQLEKLSNGIQQIQEEQLQLERILDTGENFGSIHDQAAYLTALRERGLATGAAAQQGNIDTWLESGDFEALNAAVEENRSGFKALEAEYENLTQDAQELEQAIKMMRLALDEDVDSSQWESLTNYLKSLKGQFEENEIDAAIASEAILRFAAAAEQGSEKYKDWKKALTDPESMLEQVDAVDELRNAYMDLLNIDNPDTLTWDFLTSPENLENLKLAIEGDETAFNTLAAAAGEAYEPIDNIYQLILQILNLTGQSASTKLFESYRAAASTVSGLSYGKSISDADYDDLKVFFEDAGRSMEGFFKIGADGLHVFNGSIEEFTDAINQIHFDNLVKQALDLEKQINALDSASLTVLESQGRNTSTARNQFYELDYLQSQGVIDNVTEDQLKAWREALKQSKESGLPLSPDIIEEIGNAANAAAPKVKAAKEEIESTKEEINKLHAAALEVKNTLDSDIEVESFRKLSQYLQENVNKYKDNAKAADDMAERMLRFSDAIDTVNEKSDDWTKNSKGGILSQQKVAEELIETLADLFDVDEKVINLESLDQENIIDFLDEVAAGNKDAYYQLMEALGLELDRSWDEITQATDALVNAADRLKDTFSGYATAEGIVGNLKEGSTISATQGQNLVDFFDDSGIAFNLNNYFTQMADGTLRMGENAQELIRLVDEVQLDNLEAKIKETQDSSDKASQSLATLNEILNRIGEDTAVTVDEQRQFLEQMAEAGALRNTSGMVMSRDELDQISSNNQLAELFNYNAGEGLEQYQESIKAATEDTKALQEAYDNLQQKMREDALDTDVDLDNWRNMADYIHENASELEGLSADLENSKRASDNLAEAILRFDDAIVDITKNYDDWKAALDLGAMQDYVDIVDDLKDAYADLLDLKWDDFSDQFLQSADNLDLLKEAAEGSEEAYNRLQELAGQDILFQCGIDTNQFYADRDAIWNAAAELFDYANSFEDIEIGASLDDSAFLAACSEMVNAAGMTAEQATAYLASMGIDAEVTEHEEQMQETQELPSYTVQMTPVTGNYAIPYGDGSYYQGVAEGEVVNQSQTYVPQIDTVTTTKTVKTPTLEVKSANKASGGGYKYDNASHGGGGSNPNRKSSGGGGGGSQKAKKPIKPFKAKIDPYHDVNIKIGDVEEGLEKLQKQRDKLLGKDAIKNLTEQVNLMERQKELLQEKADIAKGEAARLQGELGALGAIFEKNGDIANYKELLLDKQNQINNAIAVANGLEGDYRDAYEDYISDLKDEYSELEDKISEYDETLQLLDDLDLEYRDIINQQIELAIEAFDLEINVKLDVKDAIEDFNEFRKRIIDQIKEDDYGGQAAAAYRNYGNYYYMDDDGQVRGLVGDLYNHTRQIIQESDIIMNGGFSNIYGDNLAAAADDLKKYNDELMDALESVQDIIDEVHDNLLDAIDAMNDAFDTQQENFDKLDDLIQHDMELLQLIHGEENYDELSLLYQQQVDQDVKRLKALQEQQNYWAEKLRQYEKGTDEWEKAMENWQKAFEETNTAMINSVQNLQAQWENSINSIMKSLRNQTFGGNMNAALEDWDKMVWHSDRYLDSIDRASGLLQLQNKYIDMINKTSDPSIQEKLAQLEEQQLDALANKEHLREIDLKIAEQQLDVLQAQLALEDAQQAKTKLRLRRDSQGNYTYQYVADEDDIEEKTNEYINALAEYRQLTNDSLRQDLESLRDYTLEYYDKLQEAQMAYGDDTEALLAEQDRLYEMYFGEDGYITNLHMDAISSMSDAQEAMYINLFGLNQVLEEDLFHKFLGPDSNMVKAVEGLLAAGGTVPTLLDAFVNDSATTAFANLEAISKGAWDNATLDAIDAFGGISQGAIDLANLILDTIKGPEGMLPEWNSALWQIVETYWTDFVPGVEAAINELQYANQAYVDGLAVIQEAANRTTEQIALGLYFDTEYTKALNSATNELIAAQMAEVEMCEQVYNALMQNQKAFKTAALAATEAANANFLYWVSMQGGVSTGVPYTLDGISGNYSVSVPSVVYPQAASEPSYTASTSSGGGGDSGGSSSAPTTTTSSTPKKTGGGCFVAGTQVLMSDYTTKNIEDICPGDMVISYDEITDEYVVKKVLGRFTRSNVVTIVKLHFDNGQILEMTPGHPIYSTKGWESLDLFYSLLEHFMLVGLLEVGDEIFHIEGNSILESFDCIEPDLDVKVYTLEVADCHTFIANGFIVHNIPGVMAMAKMATGGYTGEWWSDEPKVAMLHEKELVLNKEDTSNMLDAVSIVRSIADKIQGINTMALSSLAAGGSLDLATAAGQAVLQSVVINADFPGVEDAAQIKQAFNELVNLASQQASPNRRAY